MQIKSNRYIVLAAALVIYLCMGSIYIWSILAVQLKMEHPEWTLADIALIFSLLVLTYAITTVISGRLQDRIGPRLVVTAGGIMMGCGAFLAGSMDTWWGLILCYSIMTGAGIGFSFVTLTCVVKWFPTQQRGLASGLVTGIFGAASLAFAPLAAFLINYTGTVAATFKIIGIIYLLSVTIAAQFINNPPAEPNQPAGNLPDAESGYTPGQMLKDRRFYILALLFAFGGISGLIVLSNAQQLAECFAGISGALAVSAVSILSISNGAGSVVFGILSDRAGRRNALGILFLSCSLGLFVLPFASTYLLFLLAASLVVLCYAGLFGIFPSASADYFGTRHMGVNYGLLYAGYGIAALVGPGMAARLADQARDAAILAGASPVQINAALAAGYSRAIWIACTACSFATVITFIFLTDHRHDPQSEQ